MLPYSHLTSHSRVSGSRGVITPLWLPRAWRSSLYSSVYWATELKKADTVLTAPHVIAIIRSLYPVWLFATPWMAARQASLSFTISQSLLKLMSIESVIPSNHLILCLPLLLLPSIIPSITDFSNDSALHIRWPKYWSFIFSISPSNEYPGLISFRMDWFDLLAVQGTLKNLLQHHGSKASILWCSAFFMVQLSHLYMTTRKTIALTRWTFVGKVISLLFNTLSRFVTAFLPRSKCLLIYYMSYLASFLQQLYGRGTFIIRILQMINWQRRFRNMLKVTKLESL